MKPKHITRFGLAVFVSLACAAAASAAGAKGPVKGAKYAGLVGPGYPLSFRISANGKNVDDLVVSFEETCSPGAGSVAPKFHFNTLTITHGTFSGSSTDHFGKTVSDALKINGTFDGAQGDRNGDRQVTHQEPSELQPDRAVHRHSQVAIGRATRTRKASRGVPRLSH